MAYPQSFTTIGTTGCTGILAGIIDKFHWSGILTYCKLIKVNVLFIKTYNQAKQNLFVTVF
jgi:hypothetical protein